MKESPIKGVLTSSEFAKEFKRPDFGKIGVLFSSFDCMHAGHMIMLKDAKAHCDYLVVGLQTDPTIDEDYRKGTKNKPIMSIEERYEMVLGCSYIDEIFIYETEDDLYKFLKDFEWDVRILGSDWEGKEYTGHDIEKCEIYFHKRDHDYSSSNIRKKIFDAEYKKL
jgi:glycerol-3-phosphate cytidylyltransferase